MVDDVVPTSLGVVLCRRPRGVCARCVAESPSRASSPGAPWRARHAPVLQVVLSKNPIDAVRRADSTLDARRVATFVTAESLC